LPDIDTSQAADEPTGTRNRQPVPVASSGSAKSAPPASGRRRGGIFGILLVPLLAIVTALVLGAIIIAGTDAQVAAAFSSGFGSGLGVAWRSVTTAYGALFEGSLGNPRQIAAALVAWLRGDPSLLSNAFYPITESLVTTTPYIMVGLAVALSFRAGLFNIGAEGQYFAGGLASVFVGYSLKGLPIYIHLPLMLLAGVAGGGLWGAIPGLLRATTGAHEVINTIMMNYIAFALSDWLLNGPMKRPGGFRPITPEIQPSAMLPKFFPDPIRLNASIFVALGCALLVYWLLFRTTRGFEMRTVGANPRAARYAGINLTLNMVMAMFLSGGLAGLAAASDISGLLRYMPNAFSAGYGFDSIALALLGRSHPAGVVLAALLFGVLRSGATRMQSVAQIPVDIISILQALIIIFIAAPEIIRSLYRLRAREDKGLATAPHWTE